MELQTKHNIGESVWVIYGNKPYTYVILGISIQITKYKTDISYYLKLDRDTDIISHMVSADHCFSTKEELIKSLE